MDREQVIEEARRLAALGSPEGAFVLTLLDLGVIRPDLTVSSGETPGATMPACSPKASNGNRAAST